MKAASLRRAALIWMTALLAAVGLITTTIAYRYAQNEAAEFLDGQLRQIALNAGTGTTSANAPPSLDTDPEDRFAVAIWDATGRLVHQSLPGVAIPRQPQPGFTEVKAGDEFWRVYTMTNGERTVEVAQRNTVRTEIADSAALDAAAPILIVIPLSWLVVGFALNRVLKRLNELAADLARRSAAATDPIPLAGVPSEVAPLVKSMNGLIARLQAAVQAQKRFLADAAHELRTPLAAMQIQVDNLASGGPEPQGERIAALAAGVKRAKSLVNQLLSLARFDEPSPPGHETFDAGALLLDCVAECAPLAERTEIDLGASITPQVVCRGDEAEVRILFMNLIDNAVRHTPPAGKIDVSLGRRDGRLVIEIADTGPGLPKGAETRIFDRFYRAAPQNGEGSGLGLAIAKRIAERHGFDLIVANRADGVVGVLARIVMAAEA